MRIFGTLLLISLLSCQPSVHSSELFGDWIYVRVESPNQYPPEVMPQEELRRDRPFIRFTPQMDLIIIWADKKLSYGKFRMEGKMIRYRESLEGGTFREFPFLIKELSPEKLVFETMSKDATRVTALRKK